MGAAASVDCHLRAVLCCAMEAVGRRYEELDLALQTQRLRARDAGADMVTGCEEGEGVDGRCR